MPGRLRSSRFGATIVCQRSGLFVVCVSDQTPYADKVWPRVANMGYRCLRGERWKYIQYADLHDMDELYDLNDDPYEMQNLATDPAARGALAEAHRELGRLLAAT